MRALHRPTNAVSVSDAKAKALGRVDLVCLQHEVSVLANSVAVVTTALNLHAGGRGSVGVAQAATHLHSPSLIIRRLRVAHAAHGLEEPLLPVLAFAADLEDASRVIARLAVLGQRMRLGQVQALLPRWRSLAGQALDALYLVEALAMRSGLAADARAVRLARALDAVSHGQLPCAAQPENARRGASWTERRRALRQNLNGQVALVCGRHCYDVATLDVSATGIGVLGAPQLCIGDSVRVILPDMRELTGFIVRQNDWVTGIMFAVPLAGDDALLIGAEQLAGDSKPALASQSGAARTGANGARQPAASLP